MISNPVMLLLSLLLLKMGGGVESCSTRLEDSMADMSSQATLSACFKPPDSPDYFLSCLLHFGDIGHCSYSLYALPTLLVFSDFLIVSRLRFTAFENATLLTIDPLPSFQYLFLLA